MRTTGGFRNGFGNDEYCKIHISGEENVSLGTFTENSKGGNGGSGHTVTLVGDVDPSQSTTHKFGDHSWYFNINDISRQSYLQIGSAGTSDDWSFGVINFTLDFWTLYSRTDFSGPVRLPTFISGIYYDESNYAGIFLETVPLSIDGTIIYFIIAEEVGEEVIERVKIECDFTPYLDSWTHVCVVREKDTYSLYLNGKLKDSSIYAGILPTISQPFLLGNSVTSSGLLGGLIDEFRLSKGIARWNNNFTVPNRAYGGEL